MNSLLLCTALGVLVGAGGVLLDWWGWGWAIFFGFVVFAVAWVLLLRSLGKRLHPAMMRVQKQVQAGMHEAAMQSLRDLLPLGRWVPLLRGQLLAHLGMLAYQGGDREEAMRFLSQASRRAGDAQLMRAAILWRDGDKAGALDVLKTAAMFSKKHALLHNTYAWLLHKEERTEEAQAVLAKFVQKQRADEATKDNLLRLQNRQRLSMQPFGMLWYALQLERPPAEMGEVRAVRKGFRTPPKKRGSGS